MAGSLGALVALCSCSTVKVKTSPDRVNREGLESAHLLGKVATAPFSLLARVAGSSVDLLKSGRKYEWRGAKEDAAGSYLKAAVEAHVLIASGLEEPGSEAEAALMELHNSALASFAELWIADPRKAMPGPLRLNCGAETLEIVLSDTSTYAPAFFDRVLAANAVRQKGMARRTREGYGAPMVAIREKSAERTDEMSFYSDRGLNTPVTLTIDSVARAAGADGVTTVSLSMRNPLVENTVLAGQRRLPLSADYSAPVALVLKGQSELLGGMHGFFKAVDRVNESGIYLTGPYDPDRIPVILIHGLLSVPIIWRDIIPEMTADPEISSRYQFMVFTYPSSYPLLESAQLLRDELKALRARYDPEGNDPLSRNMVLVGHSMGGLLSQCLVSDFDDKLWKQFSETPLQDAPLDSGEKEDVKDLIYFKPDPAVRRVVYFSTPHRGANVAAKGLAGLVSSVVRLPVGVIRATEDLLDPAVGTHLKVPIKGKYTSIQSLKPGAPVVAALEETPHEAGVIFHSIIGDRGRGDTPNSSDGVVEYWSSHLPGAASELIVPTGHQTYKDPRAIAELKRILREDEGLR
ncbi:MAG: hypothetical protein ABL994_06000 [Verrucomicrobiales bacterium]